MWCNLKNYLSADLGVQGTGSLWEGRGESWREEVFPGLRYRKEFPRLYNNLLYITFRKSKDAIDTGRETGEKG